MAIVHSSPSIRRGARRGEVAGIVATATELREVLARDRFDKYVAKEKRMVFVASVVREARLIEVTVTSTDCRDPKDNKFLELAVSGCAAAIISGDDDLLVLNPYRRNRHPPTKEFLGPILSINRP